MTSREFDWSDVTNKNLRTWGVAVHKSGKLQSSVAFTKDVTYIGRMPENHVVLDDPKVSRSHAKVTCIGGQYFIEDQQSENGFSVNQEKVKAKWLALGDQIQIGDFSLKVIDHVLDAPKPSANPTDDLDARTVSLIEPPEPSDLTLIVNLTGATRVYRLSLTEDEVRSLRQGSRFHLVAQGEQGGAPLLSKELDFIQSSSPPV